VRKKGARDRKAVDIVTTPYGYYKVQLNGAEKKEGGRGEERREKHTMVLSDDEGNRDGGGSRL
jgi:hypothetical protein